MQMGYIEYLRIYSPSDLCRFTHDYLETFVFSQQDFVGDGTAESRSKIFFFFFLFAPPRIIIY